jgi:hypothetical protein
VAAAALVSLPSLAALACFILKARQQSSQRKSQRKMSMGTSSEGLNRDNPHHRWKPTPGIPPLFACQKSWSTPISEAASDEHRSSDEHVYTWDVDTIMTQSTYSTYCIEEEEEWTSVWQSLSSDHMITRL